MIAFNTYIGCVQFDPVHFTSSGSLQKIPTSKTKASSLAYRQTQEWYLHISFRWWLTHQLYMTVANLAGKIQKELQTTIVDTVQREEEIFWRVFHLVKLFWKEQCDAPMLLYFRKGGQVEPLFLFRKLFSCSVQIANHLFLSVVIFAWWYRSSFQLSSSM